MLKPQYHEGYTSALAMSISSRRLEVVSVTLASRAGPGPVRYIAAARSPVIRDTMPEAAGWYHPRVSPPVRLRVRAWRRSLSRGGAILLAAGLALQVGAAPRRDAGEAAFAIPSGIRARLAAMSPGEEVSLPGWPVAPGITARVRLVAHEIYAPEAKIFVVKGRQVAEAPRSSRRHLWGAAEGDRRIRVMVSVDPLSGEVHGLVLSPQGSFAIEPVPGSRGERVELRDVRRRLVERGVRPRLGCAFDELAEPLPSPSSSAGSGSGITAQSLPSLYTATIAVDTDNEFMAQKFGDDTTAATNYIADLIAAMNVMYERDLNVRLLQGTTFLRVSTTPDPYTVQDSGGAGPNELADFAGYWSSHYGSIDRALAMLLSGRSPSSTSASGIAYLAGLCSTNYGYSFTEVFKIDYLAGDAKLVGHELGHNFGSPHTHCYDPPIDHCYNGESGCYTGPEECPASGYGTVMSYCHLLSGCSSILQFHPTVVSRIDTYTTAAEGVCLFPASTPDTTPPVISDAVSKPRITTPGQTVTITAAVVDADSGVASVTATVRDGGGAVITASPMVNTTGDLYSVAVDTTAYSLDTYTVDIQAVDSSPSANTATAVAATSFELRSSFPCNITISNITVTGPALYEACGTITLGPGVTVTSTGQLTALAGTRVSLTDGCSVASGGRVSVGVDPTLDP